MNQKDFHQTSNTEFNIMPDAPATLEAPVAQPQTATPAPEPSGMDNVFSSLDSISNRSKEAPSKQPAPAKQATPAPAKTAAKTAATDTASSTAKKDAGTTTAKPTTAKEPPAEKPLDWKTAPGNFRESHKKLQESHDRLKSEFETLKGSAPKEINIREHEDYKKLAVEHDGFKKKYAEMEEKVRYMDYSQSDEYKEKYQQPYEKIATDSTRRAQQLSIVTKTPKKDSVTGEDTGEFTESRRAMTAQEFWDIVRSNDNDAAEMADKLFGSGTTKASNVMDWRDKILEANRAAEEAKEDFRKNGAERQKNQLAEKEQFTKAQEQQFNQHRDEAIKKYPQWFSADAEKDPDGASILKTGMDWVDTLFSDKVPADKAPRHHAAMRNKAGAFDYVVHQLSTTKAELKSALERLAEFEKSTPGNGELPAGEGGGEDSVEAKLDRLATGS